MDVRVFPWIRCTLNIFVLLSACSLPIRASSSRDENIDSRLTNMAAKMDLIDRKLSILTSGHNRWDLLDVMDRKLDTINEKLDVLISHEEKSSEVETAVDDQAFTNAVDFISVEREPASVGNAFTVRLRENAEDVFYQYHDDSGPGKIPVVTEVENGVFEATFNCEPPTGNVHLCWFIVMDQAYGETEFMRQSNTLVLALNNSHIYPASYQFTEVPVIHVDPTEAVYEPGEDITVTAYVTLDEESAKYADYLWDSFMGVDLTTGLLYRDFDRDQLIRQGERPTRNESDKSLYRNCTLLTSSSPVSGFLHFQTDSHLERDGLVRKLQMYRFIRVRPSNQTKGVPPGYLGMTQPYSRLSPKGNELYSVPVGTERELYCEAIGETVSSIEVFLVSDDGSLVPVQVQETPQSSISHRGVYWTFHAEEGSGDSDGITTFKCQALDETHGKTVTKFIDAHVAIDGSNGR